MTIGEGMSREEVDRMRAAVGMPPVRNEPRRFYLERRVDISRVSGTGRVAEGVEFSDGKVVMRWISNTPTVTVFDGSIDDVVRIHGHGGSTEVVWMDD